MAFTISDFHSITNSFIQKIKSACEKLMGHFFKTPSTILFLGVDNSGKTTLIQKLKHNLNAQFLPTHNLSYEKIQIGNLNAIVVDIGGHQAARKAWKDYFVNINGIVFMVDVVDTHKYWEVADAWNTVVSSEANVPILVVMNKIDEMNHTTQSIESDVSFKQYVEENTKISELRNPGQKVKIIYLSVLSEDVFNANSTLNKGFEWLSQNVKK